MKIYILGASTQGQFVMDIINSCPGLELGGFYDDRFPGIRTVNGVDILGKIEDADFSLSKYLALGIGDPKIRKNIFEEKKKEGFKFPSIIHSRTVISSTAKIGEGVTVGPFSTVLYESIIYQGVCILSHVNINQNVSIGAFSLIGVGAIFGNRSRIGEGCHIGMGKIINPGMSIPPWTDFK